MVHVIKYTSMVEDANMMEDVIGRNKALLEVLHYAKAHVNCFIGKNYVYENEKPIACIMHNSNR